MNKMASQQKHKPYEQPVMNTTEHEVNVDGNDINHGKPGSDTKPSEFGNLK